jgi:hypothetical protein
MQRYVHLRSRIEQERFWRHREELTMTAQAHPAISPSHTTTSAQGPTSTAGRAATALRQLRIALHALQARIAPGPSEGAGWATLGVRHLGVYHAGCNDSYVVGLLHHGQRKGDP